MCAHTHKTQQIPALHAPAHNEPHIKSAHKIPHRYLQRDTHICPVELLTHNSMYHVRPAAPLQQRKQKPAARLPVFGQEAKTVSTQTSLAARAQRSNLSRHSFSQDTGPQLEVGSSIRQVGKSRAPKRLVSSYLSRPIPSIQSGPTPEPTVQ